MCREERDNVVFCLYRSAVLIGSRAIDLVGFELGGVAEMVLLATQVTSVWKSQT